MTGGSWWFPPAAFGKADAAKTDVPLVVIGGNMKYAAIIEYGSDKALLKANHAAHRAYFRTFLESGQLRAAGPFADDAGALWVLDADSAEAAEEMVKGDPLVEAGVITSWRICPIAYWSAQEAKGAR